MKAIVGTEYGSPDVLGLREIDAPAVEDDGVLVRVHAASVNPLDWHFMRGQPYFVRVTAGLRRPKRTVPGVDVAGRIEAVGKDVTEFHPGDEVFGTRGGAFAEYASGKNFVPKPAGLTFEQAAAIPIAGCTALQGLRDRGEIKAGQKVLVNGAAGGVGTFAVQIAKTFGAEVTGVCSTRNLDLVRSIGADHVVDYTQEDFTQAGQRYDLILDCVGNRSLSDVRRPLAPTGALVLAAGGITRSLRGVVLSRLVGRRMLFFLAKITREDLVVLTELFEAGKVTPVIDRTYPLSEAPEAIRYLEAGHARGKVVITV